MTWSTTQSSFTPYYDPGILSGYQQRYSDAMAQLGNWGNQQKADLNQTFANAQSRGMQGLVNRGMTGTTIMPSMRMGYATQQANAMNRLNESLNAQRLRYQTDLSGDTLSYQANARQQAYANALSMMQMQNQPSQYSGSGQAASPGYSGFSSSYNPSSPQLGSSFVLPIGRAWWSGLT